MRLHGHVEFERDGRLVRAESADGYMLGLHPQWVTVARLGCGTLLVGWDQVVALGGWSPLKVSS